MTLITTLELIKGAAELARSFDGAEAQTNNPRALKARKQLIDALRDIYFAPKGVLGLLQEIADGGYPSEEKVSFILPNFNDREDWVDRARYRLHGVDLIRNASLSLKATRVLGEISYGKGGVRTKVKDLLNASLTFDERISPEDARHMIQEIKVLNEAIEDAEEKLLELVK